MNQVGARLSGALEAGHVVSATIHEAISEPTRAVVDVIMPDELDGEASLLEPVTIALTLDGTTARQFHLVVTACRHLGIYDFGDGRKGQRYVVELRHELFTLKFRSDVRLFQDDKPDDIIKKVIDGAGLAGSYRFAVSRALVPRTYCVEYRETDFNFVSRLLEHEGIFYVEDHSGDAPAVDFSDDASGLGPIEGPAEVPMLVGGGRGDGIESFSLEVRDGPDQCTLGDYDFEHPNLDLTSQAEIAGGGFDWYEFPGGYTTADDGAALVEIRAQEQIAHRTLGRGKSYRMALRAGATFRFEMPTRPGFEDDYLLLSVEHRVIARPQDAGRGDAPSYENDLTCLPKAMPFRPARRARTPHNRGAHAAVVTGPSGSEIHTDEYGRMKGKFFWDRENPADDQSSCWMRVSQLPISGSMAIARMSWEMAVVYAFGDPDRPTAISRLYNAEKISPYGYPAAASKMSIQTPTSPGGGSSNELRLSDGGGSQEFFVNATKDMNGTTKNNKTEDIGVDDTRTVGTDSSLQVTVDQTIDIGASLTTTISADQGNTIDADRDKTVGGSETVTVSDNITAVVKGSDSETVGGSHTTLAALGIDRTAVGSYSLTVGGAKIAAAASDVSFAVAGATSETVGGAKIVASGDSVNQSCVGAMAITVGGVCLQAAGGGYGGGASGPSAFAVGGVAMANAAGNITIKSPKVSVTVAGVANFLGGGGILTLTAGSASFVGLVKLDASSKLKITGNPNILT